MKTITVLDNQTVQDVAVQYYGSVEGQWWLMTDNAVINSLTDRLNAGDKLLIRSDSAISRDIVEYFSSRLIAIVAGEAGNGGDYDNGFSNDFNIQI